jgi:hypothetical protein
VAHEDIYKKKCKTVCALILHQWSLSDSAIAELDLMHSNTRLVYSLMGLWLLGEYWKHVSHEPFGYGMVESRSGTSCWTFTVLKGQFWIWGLIGLIMRIHVSWNDSHLVHYFSLWQEELGSVFEGYLLRNDMTSQGTSRGHHLGPQRGKVLCKRPRLSALSFFHCQAKIPKGKKSPDIHDGNGERRFLGSQAMYRAAVKCCEA